MRRVSSRRVRCFGSGSIVAMMLLVWPEAVPAQPATPPATALFEDRTASQLIGQLPEPKHSMGASAADLDGDGDLDIAIAIENGPNRLLINDGTGRLTDESVGRLLQTIGDHEDVAIADYDGDDDLDLVFVGEDDQVYGYHLNDGSGHFNDVTDRLPRRGTSNAVVAADVDLDGDPDLVVGNNGQDFLFLNRGDGTFEDETAGRLPVSDDITQDVAAGDIDADGDIDLVLGNEDGNKVLTNDGAGNFADETADRYPAAAAGEETRDADLEDVDGDGDLDLFLANVLLFAPGVDPQDRLLINDGTGRFFDETTMRLPAEQRSTMSAGFLDFDADGDLDIVTGPLGDLGGETAPAAYQALVNEGDGRYSESASVLPPGVTGNGFDVEPADLDGDGQPDLFLASRGQTDRVLIATLADH
jgi:hypothetical protein